MRRKKQIDTSGMRVVVLPPGRAEGAVDSSRASLKAAPGRGKALKSGVPATPSKNPKARNRKTKAKRNNAT